MGIKFWLCVLIAWLLLFIITCFVHIKAREEAHPQRYKIENRVTTTYNNDAGHLLIIEESMRQEEEEDRYMY